MGLKLLSEDARLVCDHTMGVVGIAATQGLATVGGRRLLVENDPEGRPIAGCPNASVVMKPCTSTLAVKVGYSALVRIAGRRACLDTVSGLTDGTPPGLVSYSVRHPGQDLAEEL